MEPLVELAEARNVAVSATEDRQTIVIPDTSKCCVTFNVMPGRAVSETLSIRSFRVGSTWIEAEFDRSYSSAMLNSPSHLTFVAALVQMQKIAYVYCCTRLGYPVDLESSECLKIWPTAIEIRMPGMVTDESVLVHRLDVEAFRRLGKRKYLATAVSRVGALAIKVSAMIHLLRDA